MKTSKPDKFISKSSKHKPIAKFYQGNMEEVDDLVSIEEPLEISLAYGPKENRQKQALSVTMRTPGDDFNLAAGFLFTEGIITQKADIISIKYTSSENADSHENYLLVELDPQLNFNPKDLSRHFYTASSCGVCGKSAIELVNKQSLYLLDPSHPKFARSLFFQLPNKLQSAQNEFSNTGGIHASALINSDGKLLHIAEDVGRHNAMDKLIGKCMSESLIPLRDKAIMVSGRSSFELVQKAWMAGVALIAGVGAPSSLAIELAEEAGITLIGFLKKEKFNVYTGTDRLL